jgi:hypothetical protein
MPNRELTTTLGVTGWKKPREANMNDELRFLGMAPLFGVAGALATAVAWHVFAVTVLDMVPAQFAVLSCLVAGLGGPAAVWLAVWMMARRRRTPRACAMTHAASLGLGLVLAAEIGFYIPLGIFAVAFFE